MLKAKISDKTILEIFNEIKKGKNLREIAKEFNVSYSTVRRIKNGEGRYGQIVAENIIKETASKPIKDEIFSVDVPYEINYENSSYSYKDNILIGLINVKPETKNEVESHYNFNVLKKNVKDYVVEEINYKGNRFLLVVAVVDNLKNEEI